MSKDTAMKAGGGSETIAGQVHRPFTREEAIAQALAMLESSRFLLVGTIAEDGFPNIKAMNYRKHEGLKTIWLRTRPLTRHVQQMKRDNRVCIYCLDGAGGRGLMLVGTVEILQDVASKQVLWDKDKDKYFPRGIEDPEYTVLRFTAIRANMVPKGNKGLTFDID